MLINEHITFTYNINLNIFKTSSCIIMSIQIGMVIALMLFYTECKINYILQILCAGLLNCYNYY